MNTNTKRSAHKNVVEKRRREEQQKRNQQEFAARKWERDGGRKIEAGR